ncbi:RNA polymerase sigma factor [Singulisphaera rosea]
MIPTSVSLLDRLRGENPAQTDWLRMHDIYRPLINRWLARIPGLGDEVSDLAQEVLIVMIREIPRFERRREGSFRAWLRQVTVNKVRSYRRQRLRIPRTGSDPTESFLDDLAAPDGELAREWDLEHDSHVVKKLLAIVQPDFTPSSWDAFQKFALEGRPAAEVSLQTGLTENAVLQAKSRILKRLRTEAGELLK